MQKNQDLNDQNQYPTEKRVSNTKKFFKSNVGDILYYAFSVAPFVLRIDVARRYKDRYSMIPSNVFDGQGTKEITENEFLEKMNAK